ncbi:hypothetical protein AKJ60_00285 [candidate division MSBL1 archaeon SCGC-AAA385M11]|nr:hypothetical protein AKJ60_00285 [candidate division MSBL1 archaeon SCGC-AAA385M11]
MDGGELLKSESRNPATICSFDHNPDQVKVNGRREYTSFKRLGMTKGKEDRLTVLGALFESFPYLIERDLPIPPDKKKSVSDLRRLLRRAFPRIEGDPFAHKQDYFPVFSITKHEQYDD